MTKFDAFDDCAKSAQNWCFFGLFGELQKWVAGRVIEMFDVDVIGTMKSWRAEKCERVTSIEKVRSGRSKMEGPKKRREKVGVRELQWSFLGV